MAGIAKQVVNFRVMKGFTAAQSREHQRAWTEKGWDCAVARGNYDRSRERLNFEIAKGGIIRPIDKSLSIPKRMAKTLAERGITDPNEGLEEPKFRTVVDFILSGSQERMREMAFGTQEVVYGPGNNTENYSLRRMPEIEHWTRDMYDFVCDRYGEENIIGFYIHMDETTPHLHCTILPIENRKFAFKKMFAGKDKYEYKQKTAELHDAFAEVNRPWGLARGTSITQTEARHMPVEQYRRYLEELCATKEEELSNLHKALSAIRTEMSTAERRIKGLTTMVGNLENERSGKLDQIANLQRLIANSEGDKAELEKRIRGLQTEVNEVDEKLADKQGKLTEADRKYEELKADMGYVEERTGELRQSAMEYSRQAQSGVAGFIKDAMLESMVSDYQQRSPALSASDQQLFDDSTLQSISEKGNEVMQCATMLFLGYIDQATTFAEGHGGGGGGSDVKWGRDDDEDNRQWARRCLAMANKMMKPSVGRGRRR